MPYPRTVFHSPPRCAKRRVAGGVLVAGGDPCIADRGHETWFVRFSLNSDNVQFAVQAQGLRTKTVDAAKRSFVGHVFFSSLRFPQRNWKQTMARRALLGEIWWQQATTIPQDPKRDRQTLHAGPAGSRPDHAAEQGLEQVGPCLCHSLAAISRPAACGWRRSCRLAFCGFWQGRLASITARSILISSARRPGVRASRPAFRQDEDASFYCPPDVKALTAG